MIVHSPQHLPNRAAVRPGQMYARNVMSLPKSLVKGGKLSLDFTGEMAYGGRVRA